MSEGFICTPGSSSQPPSGYLTCMFITENIFHQHCQSFASMCLLTEQKKKTACAFKFRKPREFCWHKNLYQIHNIVVIMVTSMTGCSYSKDVQLMALFIFFIKVYHNTIQSQISSKSH